MPNERVSQLTELFASEITSDDIFLVTDVSQRESKKMEVGQLLLFIENSGSFLAYHSVNSDSASYIKASGIDGIVAFATNASQSISSSFTNTSKSSSYAANATSSSYSSFCVTSTTTSDTASFLKYTGVFNGSASYALKTSTADSATQAISLFYNGTPNGTASFAVSASNAITASYAITASSALSSSTSTSSSFSALGYYSSYSGTSSVASVAIQATAADTASYIASQAIGPKFITPYIIASTSSAAIPWVKFNCPTQLIPIGTSVIIVDAFSSNANVNTAGFVLVSKQAALTASAYYIVIGFETAGGGDVCTFGGQATAPCSSSISNSSSFYYTFTQPSDGGTTLRLIGYY